MEAPSLEAFKARLDAALGSLGCWLVTLHIAGGWNEMITVVLQYLKEAYKHEKEWLFMWVDSDRKRGNGFKLRQGRSG